MMRFNHKRVIVIVSWIAVFVWMLIIFQLSSQVAEESNELSKGLTVVILETVGRAMSGIGFGIILLYSVFMYLLFGALVIHVMRRRKGYGLSSVTVVISKPVVILSGITVLLWTLLSSTLAGGSTELSMGIIATLTEAMQRIFPSTDVDIINSLVRKNAHFFVYFILGVLVVNAIRRSGVAGFASIGLSMAICILCAISDEVHQMFVPGRGEEVSDVLIDSVGALVGVGVYMGSYLIYRRKKRESN